MPETREDKDIAGFVGELERRGASPHTVRNYVLDLEVFARWFEASNGEGFQAAAVTPTDIRRFKGHQQSVGKFAPATVNRRLATLQSFCDWAVGQEKLTTNPARDIKRVETPTVSPKALSRVELNRLTREAEKDAQQGGWLGIRNLAIIQTLRYTGLRVGELCALEADDIYMSPRKGHVTVRDGKGGTARKVPLNVHGRRALEAYFEVRPATGAGALFLGRRGALGTSAVRSVIHKYGTRAGLEGVTPHVLRHSFGRAALDAGADLVTVATLLGHAKLETTMIYTHPSEQDLRHVVGRIE